MGDEAHAACRLQVLCGAAIAVFGAAATHEESQSWLLRRGSGMLYRSVYTAMEGFFALQFFSL